MDWAELSQPPVPAAPAQTPDARPHKESWEAWGEDAAGPPPTDTGTSPSTKLDPRLPLAFSLLCFASVSMTLGNKWLMTRPGLRPHTELIVILQNGLAVCVTGALALLGAVRVKPVSRRQMLYFSWDAAVLAVQTWTSFQALQHLSVSAATVCRVLAIPTVAWLERAALGTRLPAARHACGWVVVAGALFYARDDLARDAGTAAGYSWALANLVAFCCNSVIDKLFMSKAEQTAAGMAMLTQLLSLPLLFAQLLLAGRASPLASAAALLRGLSATEAAVLLATAALAALLGQCYARCYMLASATAVTIASNVNKAVAILLSVALFGARMTAAQLAGLSVCLCGALAFSLLGQRSRSTAKRE